MTCVVCGQVLQGRPRFLVRTSKGLACTCFTCAVQHPPMLRRSVVIGLVVGTILTAINQGDLLFSGRWAPSLWWKVPLTHAIPFIVATLGALGNARAPADNAHD